MASDLDKTEAPPVRVIDRRFWARPDDEGEGADAGPSKPSFVEQLEGRIRDLEQKIQENATRYREALNEVEATTARVRRDAGQEAERRVRTTLVELLEVIDNLDRAVEAARAAGDQSALLQGVSMARDLFVSKLRGFGIERFQTMGMRFDPSRHEAVTTVAVEDVACDGTVVGIIEEGYVMGQDVLRAARVAVGRRATR